jgi:2-polyprenyl-6-methoxyphenol hydroxylase-like FAD-dependent oxidoreductase
MSQAVLVVGAGPVGLTMAADLARYRVPVRIIDKAPARTDKSKALVIWSRSLELMARMGCADRFVAAGMKVTAANIVAGGERIARIGLDMAGTPYPYALMIPQSETERLMEEELNSRGVYVERQLELVGFASGDDGVTAILRHADGREESIETPWLIGSDGAHSAVRHGLGMAFEGNTIPTDWALADVHLSGEGVPVGELGIYWHTEGILALFPITPGRWRVIADVGITQLGAHRSDPTLEEIQALLDQRGPGGIQATEPIWLSCFTINERKVADYSTGRVFLTGDAAHIHSPAGGQGMNTGMQDAFNLAWKLALVSRGLASPDPLIASYSVERSEVGRQVLAAAGNLTKVAMLRGRVRQSLRNHIGALLFGLTPVRRSMTNTMSELSIGYPKGPLTEEHAGQHSGPAAGSRAPVLPDADPIGGGDTPRFTLFGHAGPQSAALISRRPDQLEPQVRPPFAPDGLWLVRPDGYVAATAAGGDWARIGTHLDAILGKSRDIDGV